MPKPIRLNEAKNQYKTFTTWEQLCALMPTDDPLREEVIQAVYRSRKYNYNFDPDNDESIFSDEDEITFKNNDGEKFTMSSAEALDPGNIGVNRARMVNPAEKGLVNRIDKDLKLLDKIDKKYKGKEGHEYLNILSKNIRLKEQSFKDGIGICLAPGAELYNFGMQKMTDCLCDLEPGMKDEKGDLHKYKMRDPKNVEAAMKKYGVTDIMDDYTNISVHNIDFMKEWNKSAPDPKKLRKAGEKLKQDMNSMQEHIEHFETKFLKEKDRVNGDFSKSDLLDLTNQDDIQSNDIIYDFRQGLPGKSTRGPNGPNYESAKKSFLQTLEKHITAADLMEVDRTTKHDKNSELSKKVDALVVGCMADYWDSEESKNGVSKRAAQYDYMMRVKMLQELELEAAKTPNDPYAKKVAKVAHDHLRTPESTKALSDLENSNIVKEIDESKLMVNESKDKNVAPVNIEDKLLDDARFDLKGLAEINEKNVPEDSTPEQHFNWTKQNVTDELAKVLAVQTLVRTIKSHRAALNDMAAENGGEGMTQDEINEMAEEMLTPDNISACAEEMKKGPEFQRMMDGVTNWASLKALEKDALTGNGMKLMDHLSKARNEIIKEDTQKLRMENQMHKEIQQPKLDNPVMQ